jgi:hypothetical protein
VLIAFLLCAQPAVAQKSKPLSDVELAQITARGRMLQDYDVASWYSTDAVQALKPLEGSVKRYIARKTGDHWVVEFGRFDDTQDAFLIVYEATQGSAPQQFSVKTYDPPQKDTGFFFAAAKAVSVSLQNTQLEKRPYNAYVLPLDSGQMYVYILPAQTVTDVYPLGGDVRYLVSADGGTIIETRQLHKSILEFRHSAPGGKTLAAGYHTHVLTDTPEDTDVFHVLRQKPPLPEYVGTKSGIYIVQTDGTIKRTK